MLRKSSASALVIHDHDAEIATINDDIARFQSGRSSSSSAAHRTLISNASLFQDPLTRLASTLDFMERSAEKHELGASSLQRTSTSYDADLQARMNARRSQTSAATSNSSAAAVLPKPKSSFTTAVEAPLSTSAAASEARSMISLLLAIPRHLSWVTYARVSSNSRLLPAIHFFIPKATIVQRWYRGCRVRRCLMHLKAASSSFCSLFARAARAIASNMPSGAATPRSRSNLSGPMSLKWAQCQGLQLHVVVVDFEHGLTRLFICSEPAVHTPRHALDRHRNIKAEAQEQLQQSKLISHVRGALDSCASRVQRAWCGHWTRKTVLGNGAFVFRDLMRVASALDQHDWLLHQSPPPLFLQSAPAQARARAAVCLTMFAQAWWQHRQAIESSLCERASMCFIRRVLLHVTSCVGDANSFLSVLSGLAETCGLSKRDVSQCAGPFDQVLSRLKSIQSAASAALAAAPAAKDDAAAGSSFLLHDICAAIIAASPVFCSFCNLAPSLIAHIDTMRVMPSVTPYLQQEDRCFRIQTAFTRVLDFIGKLCAALDVVLLVPAGAASARTYLRLAHNSSCTHSATGAALSSLPCRSQAITPQGWFPRTSARLSVPAVEALSAAACLGDVSRAASVSMRASASEGGVLAGVHDHVLSDHAVHAIHMQSCASCHFPLVTPHRRLRSHGILQVALFCSQFHPRIRSGLYDTRATAQPALVTLFSDIVVATAPNHASSSRVVISAASISCICNVIAQAADGVNTESLSITWSDSLHWEVTVADDDSRAFCVALLQACPADVRQVVAGCSP